MKLLVATGRIFVFTTRELQDFLHFTFSLKVQAVVMRQMCGDHHFAGCYPFCSLSMYVKVYMH